MSTLTNYGSQSSSMPAGWAHATTFTSYFTNAGDTPGQILFSLGSDTTAVLCCPSKARLISTPAVVRHKLIDYSGYGYIGEAGYQCGTAVSSGAEVLYVSTSLSNNAVVQGAPSTSTITDSADTIWGDGIPVWW